VKVVRPLRCVHSLVTERMASIGRMMATGTPTAAPKLSKVRALSSANRITATVAITEVMAMLMSIQNPDRVSNILRSSTPMIRLSGIAVRGTAAVSRGRRATGPACRGTVVVAVVMPLLLLVGSLR
jgi:hypothetical protein